MLEELAAYYVIFIAPRHAPPCQLELGHSEADLGEKSTRDFSPFSRDLHSFETLRRKEAEEGKMMELISSRFRRIGRD